MASAAYAARFARPRLDRDSASGVAAALAGVGSARFRIGSSVRVRYRTL
jgi:hypothetical protein